jgi:hypothetical protein
MAWVAMFLLSSTMISDDGGSVECGYPIFEGQASVNPTPKMVCPTWVMLAIDRK